MNPLCNNSSENDYDIEEYFCEKCMIIYEKGCKHADNGCTDDINNAHFIGKYKYKDEIYIGMAQLDNISQRKEIEILEWICPNNGSICSYKSYKDLKHYLKCDILTQKNI